MPTNNAWNSLNPAQVARGGTGRNTITAHNVMIGANTNPVSLAAPGILAGIPLVSQATGLDPQFGTAVVAGGGTGATTFNPYCVVCGGTAAQNPLQSVATTGTAGQVLTSGGPGVLPHWGPGGGGVLGTVYAIGQSGTSYNLTGANNEVQVVLNPYVDPFGLWASPWFVCPVKGMYLVIANIQIYDSGNHTAAKSGILLNGLGSTIGGEEINPNNAKLADGSNKFTQTFMSLVPGNIGDLFGASIQANGGSYALTVGYLESYLTVILLFTT